ncbi:hypothetical protein ACNRBH_17855 [Ralstonia pseudosolanacearum]|uniref:hypothetical protein n=1 Tax=Ralstonia pseudosolanacearum TaxID=1310165 RepID=UPI003AAAD5CF
MKIFELGAPFVAPKWVSLPYADAYGVAHGDRYVPFLEARVTRNSTRMVFHGLKFNRRLEALSTGESRILYALLFHPYVVDIRDQYPFYDRKVYQRTVSSGQRLRVADKTTVDVVVTYLLPGDAHLHYHCISIKSERYEPTKQDSRREAKELLLASSRGWTWELMRRDAVTAQHYINCAVLHSLVRYTNIHALYDGAAQFARVLLRSERGATTDAVFSRICKRLSLERHQAYRLFATAVAFGFVRLDNTRPFGAGKPLYLKGDAPEPPGIIGPSKVISTPMWL